MSLIYQIERATWDDLAAMVELLQALFTLEQDFTPNPQRQQVGLQQLLENPQSASVWVARLPAGTVVGLCTAQLVISTAQGGYAVWIEDVIVAEPYRGGGIGKALLQHALDWAVQQGATRAQLLIDKQNLSAFSFYQQFGWRDTQLQALHYFWDS
jgi:GNAT superfamily N-acetyltransferase